MKRAVALAIVAVCAAPVDLATRAMPGTGAQPLTLLVVVDVTASMALAARTPTSITSSGSNQVTRFLDFPGAARRHMTTVISGLVRLLEPGDRIRFGRVARTIVFSSAFVAPDDAGAAASVLIVPDADRLGPSPIWDATVEALQLLEGETGRRALIIWTDGKASGNRLGRVDLERRASAAGVPIHVVSPPTEIVMRQSETLAVRIRPSVYLEWLAAETGGLFRTSGVRVDPRAPLLPQPDPLTSFREIIDSLRQDVP